MDVLPCPAHGRRTNRDCDDTKEEHRREYFYLVPANSAPRVNEGNY
jgi:hypothetical protein